MKYFNYILMLSFFTVLFSCKKDYEHPQTITIRAVNLLNTPVKINTGGIAVNYNRLPVIAAGGSTFVYGQATHATVAVVNAVDTTQQLVTLPIGFSSSLNTLYLYNEGAQVKSLFVQEEEFPYIRQDQIPVAKDSVSFVRFVNFTGNVAVLKARLVSVKSNGVDVSLPAPTELPVELLAKEAGKWGRYPVNSAAASTVYTIEISDATTNEVLIPSYSFTLNTTNYFKRISLLITGDSAAAGSTLAVRLINYF